MRKALKIIGIKGFSLSIHWTFLLLFGWVILVNWRSGSDPHRIGWSALFMLGFLASVILHELGHALADLLLHDMDRLISILTNKDRPVQIIWAGKPHPMDYAAVGIFDRIVHFCKAHANCSILVSYEMTLSKLLKQGADIWLNLPRLTHEASGTSGMSAAMNGAINLSTADGWFPEFARDKVNYPSRWLSIVKNSMQQVVPAFDSKRMAADYYQQLYTAIL